MFSFKHISSGRTATNHPVSSHWETPYFADTNSNQDKTEQMLGVFFLNRLQFEQQFNSTIFPLHTVVYEASICLHFTILSAEAPTITLEFSNLNII